MKFSLSGRIALLGSLFLSIFARVYPQEKSLEELLPAFKDQALILDIVIRVLEQNEEEIWNSFNSQITLPGRAVGLKLVGANIAASVQFTPYFRKNGSYALVAQGEIWIDVPDVGMNRLSTMQTIPLDFGEEVYFFPLGSGDGKDDPRIEIQLALHPYSEE